MNRVFELTYPPRLRERFLVWLVKQTQPYYEKLTRKHRPAWQVSKATLLVMPPGSLGRQLGIFLQQRGIELMPHFENHDVFHLMAGYDTDVTAEVCLQWLLVGNGKRSPYALGTAFLGLLLFPECGSLFRQAYAKGKAARPFHHWYFEYLLGEPLADLQRFVFDRRGGHFIIH